MHPGSDLLATLSCPAKVILFGEWAVLHGHACVGTSLKRRMRISLEKNSNQAESGIQISSGNEQCFLDEKNTVTPDFFKFASDVIRILNSKQDESLFNGHKIKFDCGWNIHEGLGSSSAVALLLCAAHDFIKYKKVLPPDEIYSHYVATLKSAQKGLGSGFDLMIQLFGNSIKKEYNKVSSHLLQFPPELRLVHTGLKMKTQTQLSNSRFHEKSFIECIAKSSENFLSSANWDTAIAEHHKALSAQGLVPTEILQAFEHWRSKNWVNTLKTTGAGGGDALMVLINPQHENKWKEDLAKKTWYVQEADFLDLGLKVDMP